MKFAVSVLLISLNLPALADTYTGMVSGVKHFHNGGIAVDLDGNWPHEKMALYIPPADVATVGALPAAGNKVTATGTIGQYRGKPELKIRQASQWKW